MSTTKKLLFITKLYKPNIGGVEKHVHSISKSMNKKFNITILTSSLEKSPEYQLDSNIRVYRISYPNKKFVGLMTIWYKILVLRKLYSNADIIHVHDIFVWILPLRFLYPHKKIFTTFHGWEGKYPIPLKSIILKKLAWKLSFKSISVGRYIQKYYGIRSEKIIFGAVKKFSKISIKKPRTIIYIGRLEKELGLDIFLDAIKVKKNYTIAFCGDGTMLSECAKFGDVYGFVDPQKYLAQADICFASGYLTIHEALCAKCVVIVNYNNDIRSDILNMTPFANKVFLARTTKDIVDIITTYEKNKKKYRTTINEGYIWSKKQTWARIAEIYSNLWEYQDNLT